MCRGRDEVRKETEYVVTLNALWGNAVVKGCTFIQHSFTEDVDGWRCAEVFHAASFLLKGI